MQSCVFRAGNLASEQGVRLEPPLIKLLHRSYDRILKEGIAFHETQPPLRAYPHTASASAWPPETAHRSQSLLRLSTRKDDVQRFLSNPDVPFHQQLSGAELDSLHKLQPQEPIRR